MREVQVLEGMKYCKRCNENHPIKMFHRDKTMKSGYKSSCKDVSKKYYIDNKEEVLRRTSSYKEKNRQSYCVKSKEYYQNNKQLYVEKSARRRTSKLLRTPSWYSDRDRAAFKELANYQRILKDIGGWAFDIDHILPLQGKTVSGLHCKENWQLLPTSVNKSKGNRYG